MSGYTPEIVGTDVEGATVDSFAMGTDLLSSWVAFIPMVILAVLICVVGVGIILRLSRLTFG